MIIREAGTYEELLDSQTVWTGVDPDTGEGTSHTYDPGDEAHLNLIRPALSLSAANPYSPDFTAASIVFPGDDDHAAVIGWVTDSGRVVRVSDMVVENDSFSSPPLVSGGQFDARGYFYFMVSDNRDNTVYKTKFTRVDDPDKPVKVKRLNGDLFVWADGRIDAQPAHAFLPSKPGSHRGAWSWGGRDFMGFIPGGWVGSCDAYSRICKYPYESAADEPVYGTKGKPISAKSRQTIRSGAIDPTHSRVVFAVGESAQNVQLFSMLIGSHPKPIDGISGEVLGWLP